MCVYIYIYNKLVPPFSHILFLEDAYPLDATFYYYGSKLLLYSALSTYTNL